ncbi:MAG: putative two-component histidine kinase, partial [Dehalococcoidia bacterium]|nr:putative two-component histidine kinase [Dehalococcoidia bacterium]
GKIAITARALDEFVEVIVEDTGAGIASVHLPHIFERFYKADRSRSSEGVGLGLALVKHLVQAQGGRVWAESALGRGSTFHFTLPRADLAGERM